MSHSAAKFCATAPLPAFFRVLRQTWHLTVVPQTNLYLNVSTNCDTNFQLQTLL